MSQGRHIPRKAQRKARRKRAKAAAQAQAQGSKTAEGQAEQGPDGGPGKTASASSLTAPQTVGGKVGPRPKNAANQALADAHQATQLQNLIGRSGMRHMSKRLRQLKKADPLLDKALTHFDAVLANPRMKPYMKMRAAQEIVGVAKMADDAARHLDRMETEYGLVPAGDDDGDAKDNNGGGQSVMVQVNITTEATPAGVLEVVSSQNGHSNGHANGHPNGKH